jgi:hypothetical protein
MKEGKNMAILDWSQCPAVESVADRQRRMGVSQYPDAPVPVGAAPVTDAHPL